MIIPFLFRGTLRVKDLESNIEVRKVLVPWALTLAIIGLKTYINYDILKLSP